MKVFGMRFFTYALQRGLSGMRSLAYALVSRIFPSSLVLVLFVPLSGRAVLRSCVASRSLCFVLLVSLSRSCPFLEGLSCVPLALLSSFSGMSSCADRLLQALSVSHSLCRHSL